MYQHLKVGKTCSIQYIPDSWQITLRLHRSRWGPPPWIFAGKNLIYEKRNVWSSKSERLKVYPRNWMPKWVVPFGTQTLCHAHSLGIQSASCSHIFEAAWEANVDNIVAVQVGVTGSPHIADSLLIPGNFELLAAESWTI